MLPAPHRMRRGADFDRAVRSGRRAGRRTLVVHWCFDPDPSDAPSVRDHSPALSSDRLADACQVGFVVARSVGGAVVRAQVKRRLRAVMARRLSLVPPGALVVIRAKPAAAHASSAVLAVDVDGALAKMLGTRSSESVS